jgi:predicted amino acid dehydrogenase
LDSFAFIIHPIDPKRDVSRKFPLLGRLLTERQINFFSRYFPPIFISEIEGIISQATGKRIKGWFIACPLTPARMLELPEKTVYRKIIETGHFAERLGADILGLGAFTSVIGDGGLTIANALDIPVTTGDSYTTAIAIKAVQKAAMLLNIPLDSATVAVVGATGAIGSVCAELISKMVTKLYLIGRQLSPLQELRDRIQAISPSTQTLVSVNIEDIKNAQILLTATSAPFPIIQPDYLQPGSIICDVARPRDVSILVSKTRNDVLIIDGGMVDIPGRVNFNFDFGLPEGKAYACMAETMALALEGRFQDFTIGKDITTSQVEQIDRIAEKHGFHLSGFRSFEKPVTPEQIRIVREQANYQHALI